MTALILRSFNLLLKSKTFKNLRLPLTNGIFRKKFSSQPHSERYERFLKLLKKTVTISSIGLASYVGLKELQVNPVYAISNRSNNNFIAEVVKKVSPAVVYIEIQSPHPSGRKMIPVSNGSGFIVDPSGVILTNAHVLANRRTVLVRLQDGRSFEGVVQAVDRVTDMATIKINASNLPIFQLGDSSQLDPGEWVIAMGSPFQLSNTVTLGIVSSAGRGSKELGLRNSDMEYIQTDAVINFGNSGGPLVNLDGEVIGINTMKVTTGISFAIPINYAKPFLKRASKLDKPSSSTSLSPVKKYIGVTMLTLNPRLIMELKIRGVMDGPFPEVDHGVLLHKVIVGSPAWKAGLRAGDVITNVNDKDIQSAKDVYSAVEESTKLKVTAKRPRGETVILNVTPEIP
ncbi:unnamed protein product [Dimorphilus gyrociliatus]|uniref:Serine protease HTRA2, mitochondrial n=1 Tax=Dimorphilus gyrociliatus TaxID=2664684 RepID=A0A7I8VJU4_9ANNE|nr:unnamed protein product [Dimorphilus gyrociliatus]